MRETDRLGGHDWVDCGSRRAINMKNARPSVETLLPRRCQGRVGASGRRDSARVRAMRRASRGSPVLRTAYPAPRKMSAARERTSGSSSTRRIVSAGVDARAAMPLLSRRAGLTRPRSLPFVSVVFASCPSLEIGPFPVVLCRVARTHCALASFTSVRAWKYSAGTARTSGRGFNPMTTWHACLDEPVTSFG